MAKILVIVECSEKKDVLPAYESSNWIQENSILEKLSPQQRETLLTLRRKVAESVPDRKGFLHSSKPGPDLGYNTSSKTVTYLQAHIRYRKGRAYSILLKEDMFFWGKVKKCCEQVDVLFLSPLYGVVRFDELIRNYDIDINDRGPSGVTPLQIWRGKLNEIIYGYAVNTGVEIGISANKQEIRTTPPRHTPRNRESGLRRLL